MKILVLTFYYPPDLSAGSFRASALVDAIMRRHQCVEIDVLTTMPNRYHSHRQYALLDESSPRLRIRRIPLAPHRNGLLDQTMSFATYARGVLRLVRGEQYSLVFATSSRLLTASLGAFLSRRLKTPVYLDIRDIFVDTIRDVLPRIAPFSSLLFSPVERWTIGHAQAVNLISEGFSSYFEPRYPERRFRYFTNGIDDIFLQKLPAVPRQGGLLNLVYAGNVGDGQGLHKIVPALAKALEGKARFKIIGDGGRREQLKSAIHAGKLTNVELMAPMRRDDLVQHYAQADVLFLHLNDYPAFKKVLPSKLFEYAATGKPILAGLAGYPADFARTEIENCAVFAPGDAGQAERALESLVIDQVQRREFVERYPRWRIMAAMADDIISVARKP